MKIQRLEIWAHEARKVLLPLVQSSVFHTTSWSAFEKIQKSGYIDPNSDGKHGESFPQSRNSYGRHIKAVCLFDFKDRTDVEITQGMEGFYPFGEGRLGNHFALCLLSDEVRDTLIPPNPRDDHEEIPKMYIPHVEVWYPGPLPIHLIREVLDVSITRKPSEYPSFEELFSKT